MATLTGNTIADTYAGLLSVTGAISTGAVEVVQDGAGTNTALWLATERCEIVLGTDSTDDFTVSSGGTDILVVEGDERQVGINTASPGALFHILTANAGTVALLESTEAGATSGPDLIFRRNSESPEADDELGSIIFQGEDAGDGVSPYAGLSASIVTTGAGSEEGRLELKTVVDGSYNTRLTVNEKQVGFGTKNPDHMLHISSSTGGPWEGICLESTAVHGYTYLDFLGLDDADYLDNPKGIRWQKGSDVVTMFAGQPYRGGQDTSAEYSIGSSHQDSDSWIYIRNERLGVGSTNPPSKITAQAADADAVHSVTAYQYNVGKSCLLASAYVESYTSNAILAVCNSNASTDFTFLATRSDNDGSGQYEHKLYGDGTSNATGAWSDSLSDYAEYFETSDGNAIAPGVTVVLVDGKIRPSVDGESPIGVIRPYNSSSIVGGNQWNKWRGKWLKTPYGNYDLDANGHRQQNPDFIENLDDDGEQIYSPTVERDEWQIVGLLGQVPIDKDQPMSSSWIKMWEITDDVDMYYIFPS